MRGLGIETASFNLDDRLMFYSKALIDTGEKDETGHPIVKQAMSQGEAITAAIQGITHALYTFWPDVVICVSGFFLQAGVLDIIRTRRHTSTS